MLDLVLGLRLRAGPMLPEDLTLFRLPCKRKISKKGVDHPTPTKRRFLLEPLNQVLADIWSHNLCLSTISVTALDKALCGDFLLLVFVMVASPLAQW